VLRRYRAGQETTKALEFGNLHIDLDRREVTVDGTSVELRAKEFDLLATFALNPGVVFTREKLLDLVWGFDYLGDSRTIDVHITWLREKLGNSQARIKTVWGVGYKLVPPKAGEE